MAAEIANNLMEDWTKEYIGLQEEFNSALIELERYRKIPGWIRWWFR